MNPMIIALCAGVVITVVTLALALGLGRESAQSRLRKRAAGLRHRRIAGTSKNSKVLAPTSVKRSEGRSVAMIEDIAKRYLPRQSELRNRLSRAGITMTIGTYALVNLGVAAVTFVGILILDALPLPAAAALALTVGAGLPHLAIGFLTGRRRKKFMVVLPDAIDLIVRGVKSGLPVTESMAVVGREMQAPLGTEFRHMTDSIRFGQGIDEVLWETAHRMEIPEFNFFVICLSIQRETGGNLAETLANLADILRKRRQIRLKVSALSAEARFSAYILGALPFVMFGILHVVNPAYAALLYTDPRGHVMAIIALALIATGFTIMTKMIRFQI